MLKTTLPIVAFLALAPHAFAAGGEDGDHVAEHREAGAHEHGHGAFAMAIEDDSVAIELEVPAYDILGFEHEAGTEAQHAAVDAAEARLSDPLSLFVLPATAGCTLVEAHIAIGPAGEDGHDEHGEEHHDEDHEDHNDHGDGHEDHDDHDEDHDDHEEGHEDHDDHAEGHEDHDDHGEEVHSEVHAEYALTCADTAAISSVEFAYFDAFPNAEELEVVVLNEAGQHAAEATGEARIVDIE